MVIEKATKNITETLDGYGVIVTVVGGDEKWSASFEEDDNHNLMVDRPIKVLYKKGDEKTLLKSYREYSLTNDIVKMLDKIITMFDNSPKETKRVLL